MAHVAGHASFNHNSLSGKEHWKYPDTVGNDTMLDDINFNSHQSSEYAVERMSAVSGMTGEPFMLFEFMKINVKESEALNGGADFLTPAASAVGQTVVNISPGGLATISKEKVDKNADAIATATSSAITNIKAFAKNISSAAKRDYTGSIALYMPTDIQINDSMGYNEDTRKLGAAIQGYLDGDSELNNAAVLTDPAVLALAGGAIGMLPFMPPMVSTILGGTVGVVLNTEVQRATGKIMNPNELLRYQNTALRTFSFNWIILPDSENESKQAAGLIKFFRKSAHANRTSSTLVTVPDHVVTSFHGGGNKDVAMIQLPPCYIESVNVTYNPNNSSFFKQNNAPVEIGLGITLKEIIPIYAQDVEDGF